MLEKKSKKEQCIICKTEMDKLHEKICDDCLSEWTNDELAILLPALVSQKYEREE